MTLRPVRPRPAGGRRRGPGHRERGRRATPGEARRVPPAVRRPSRTRGPLHPHPGPGDRGRGGRALGPVPGPGAVGPATRPGALRDLPRGVGPLPVRRPRHLPRGAGRGRRHRLAPRVGVARARRPDRPVAPGPATTAGRGRRPSRPRRLHGQAAAQQAHLRDHSACGPATPTSASAGRTTHAAPPRTRNRSDGSAGDGTGALVLTGSVDRIQLADHRLTLAARAVRASGDAQDARAAAHRSRPRPDPRHHPDRPGRRGRAGPPAAGQSLATGSWTSRRPRSPGR